MTGAEGFTITRNTQNGLPESASDGTLINTRTFSGYGELDGNSYSIGGNNKYSYALIRDLAGRITQKTEIVDGETDTFNYGYDANGRLTEVKKNNLTVETYTYDANGNRLTETNTPRSINRAYTVSTEDHVITAGTETYQFNMDGFLTGKVSGSNISTYQYSSRGELLSATLQGGSVITYDHDPLGRRISKRVNGSITEKYLWKDAITLLAVYDANNNLVMRFNYADGRMPVSMNYNGSTYYPAYDQVGSLHAVVDTSGNIVKRVDYDSFGSIISDTNPAMSIPFGFAGGLHDRDTNLVRFGARDYDPTLGRWTAKDPIDFAGGDTNLYGYVANDPINLIDPLGLLAEVPGFPETGSNAWRGANDNVFVQAVNNYNFSHGLSPGDPGYWTPERLKAQAMIESGSKQSAFMTDPLQVNNPGDWVASKKAVNGLSQNQVMTPATSAAAALSWLRYKGYVHNCKGNEISYRGDYDALKRYNGNINIYSYHPGVQHRDWYAQEILVLEAIMLGGF